MQFTRNTTHLIFDCFSNHSDPRKCVYKFDVTKAFDHYHFKYYTDQEGTCLPEVGSGIEGPIKFSPIAGVPCVFVAHCDPSNGDPNESLVMMLNIWCKSDFLGMQLRQSSSIIGPIYRAFGLYTNELICN